MITVDFALTGFTNLHFAIVLYEIVLYIYAIMKCLVVIWAFYFIALSIVPCSDGINKCEDLSSSRQNIKDLLLHDHNQDQDDYCSPFCQCSCCSVTLTVFHFEILRISEPFSQFISDSVVITDSSVVCTYTGSIWQPPQPIA
ncbi:DUF6660 family protein [Sphingobacterium spiritivorum]|uniref:DUF6660 family protein n=2 Tax=Sphingobacterium spiritivorum TaxID=258 RepID=UPI003DA1F716